MVLATLPSSQKVFSISNILTETILELNCSYLKAQDNRGLTLSQITIIWTSKKANARNKNLFQRVNLILTLSSTPGMNYFPLKRKDESLNSLRSILD